MKLQNYNDVIIETLRKTDRPAELVCMAARQTQVMVPSDQESNQEDLIKYLVKAEHHSVFEHATITVRITGCSRSFLTQVTRQRAFSFTSSSQHYQDYQDYPCVVRPELKYQPDQHDILHKYAYAFAVSMKVYKELLEAGEPKEEARQVLPNASAVNLVMTMDARNMMYFLRQRRCERNVTEMKQIADALQQIGKDWFPELFSLVGPPCFMDGQCNQGSMKPGVCNGKG